MIHSMTAFARREVSGSWGNAVWELRSINHRYLELSLHFPEAFSELEVIIRERLRQQLHRGKVDCTLRYHPKEENTPIEVNQSVAQQLSQAIQVIQSKFDKPVIVNAMEILRWPGIMQTLGVDHDSFQESLLQEFNTALEELIAARIREGTALKTTLESRLTSMEKEIAKITKRLPEVLQMQRDKLLARFNEAKVILEPQRLEQEMILVANRLDVAEEIDRLQAHIAEVQHILSRGGAVGRRLDFLTQELNREANTLAAKSIDAEATRSTVELKVLIEQLREQIQNIE